MLPPVPKLPAADASYTATTAAAGRTQPAGTVPAPIAVSAAEIDGSLFAKATIASLASEYQLSRSTFILSETLGKLMNLPRQDGEAIETYVARLADALRAMPAPQRAALEQQVSKALQGLTLSMLTDILKNPAGPDAARLALLIELSRYKGLDLAAKAVVTSYQQNNRTDLPTSLALPSRMPDAQKPAPVGEQTPPVTNQAALGSPANKLVAQVFAQLTQLAAPMKDVMTARVALPEVPNRPNVQNADSGVQAPKPARQDVNIEPSAKVAHQDQKAESAKATSAGTRSDNLTKSENGRPQSAGQNHDAAARPRAEMRPAPNASPNQIALQIEEAESFLFAALTGKGPSTASTHERPLPVASGTAPATPENLPGEKTDAPLSTAQTARSEPETPEQHSVSQTVTRVLSEQELKTATFEQAATQPLIASLLAKEGTPLPFVSYPPAKDEPESETPHRGHPPFSEGDADENAEEQGEPGEIEERAAANDAAEVQTAEDPGAGMNDESAEHYYLRMGGIV